MQKEPDPNPVPAATKAAATVQPTMFDAWPACRRRQAAGGTPYSRLNARLNAVSVWSPTSSAMRASGALLRASNVPDPEAALRELHRVLRPGGRAVLAVWGERAHCGWAPLFGIVDAEVRSEVCPLFFGLGQGEALARRCACAGLQVSQQQRRSDWLDYADGAAACAAAFAGGPVALAWSRFDATVRERVQSRYLEAIAPWRHGSGYRVPVEYLIVAAQRPAL